MKIFKVRLWMLLLLPTSLLHSMLLCSGTSGWGDLVSLPCLLLHLLCDCYCGLWKLNWSWIMVRLFSFYPLPLLQLMFDLLFLDFYLSVQDPFWWELVGVGDFGSKFLKALWSLYCLDVKVYNLIPLIFFISLMFPTFAFQYSSCQLRSLEAFPQFLSRLA